MLWGGAFVFYAYQSTGSATQVTLVALASFLPKMLLSPTAGHLVDRLGDRFGLLLADLGSGLVIFTAALVCFSGGLELWHLYTAAAVAGAAETVQYLAFSSALTRLVRCPPRRTTSQTPAATAHRTNQNSSKGKKSRQFNVAVDVASSEPIALQEYRKLRPK